MNGTKKSSRKQLISLRCPEENLAALIAEAKTDFDSIFAANKNHLFPYEKLIKLRKLDLSLLRSPEQPPRAKSRFPAAKAIQRTFLNLSLIHHLQ